MLYLAKPPLRDNLKKQHSPSSPPLCCTAVRHYAPPPVPPSSDLRRLQPTDHQPAYSSPYSSLRAALGLPSLQNHHGAGVYEGMPALPRVSGKKPPPPSHAQVVTLLWLGNGKRKLKLVQGLRSFPQRPVTPPSLQASQNFCLSDGQTLPIRRTIPVSLPLRVKAAGSRT